MKKDIKPQEEEISTIDVEDVSNKFTSGHLIIILALFILAIIFAVLLLNFGDSSNNSEIPIDTLQKINISCLKENVLFFGADWCGHCRDQKEIFGEELTDAIYINCDKSLLCKEYEIQFLPTLLFLNDSSKLYGVQEIETLLNKSGCN